MTQYNDKTKWLCDNCLSENIAIFKDEKRKDSDMDCYCNSCEGENYIVSSWFIKKEKNNDAIQR